MFLLDDLLLAPLRGIAFIAGKVQEVAEREVYGETAVKRDLMELQARHEAGEIGDEEFQEEEQALFARLAEARRSEPIATVHTADAASLEVETDLGRHESGGRGA